MSRKVLFKASLPLMATPLISLVAAPAFSASAYSQQQLLSEVGAASNSHNSVLVARWDDNRDYERDRRREIHHLRRNMHRNLDTLENDDDREDRRRALRDIHRDRRRLQDLRNDGYNRYRYYR